MATNARAEFLIDLRPHTDSLPAGVSTSTDPHTLNITSAVVANGTQTITFDLYCTLTGTATDWTGDKIAALTGASHRSIQAEDP